MVKVRLEQMSEIEPLFTGIEDSMVIACLQGYGGDAYVDQLPEPQAGMIISGEYSFFGGRSDLPASKELAEQVLARSPGESSTAIYADDRLDWRDLLLTISKNNPKEVERYGIRQKDYDFDMDLLQGYVDQLPAGFELKQFDADLYRQAMDQSWSREFCETFESCEDYLKRGFGYAAVYKGELAAGASTMTVYDGGTETQVATKESFQRRGLAMPCAAAFVMECSRRGIRACWDAATLISKHMALKLGYEYKGEYSTVYMEKGEHIE